MNTTEIGLLGVALAMDCFTVSIVGGIVTRRFVWRPMLTMALAFGVFQGGMILLGYLGTSFFRQFLEPVDHWIAFGLLAYLGVRMILEDFRKEEERTFNPLDYKVILTMAVATSIDALAVGISFAFLRTGGLMSVVPPAGLVGLISFLFTLAGLAIGIGVGRKLRLPVEALGGCILIAIGVRILVEHLT